MRADIGLLEAHESLMHTERRSAIDVRRGRRAGGGERHLEQEGARRFPCPCCATRWNFHTPVLPIGIQSSFIGYA